LFLSGGVDSAILAAQLQAHSNERIKSFSIGYRGATRADELNEAARIAAHFGFNHHALELEFKQVFYRIPHSIWCADELMRDYASLPTSILAETAGASLKVVFSGVSW
jgi:asparagine synthase (glutamine-hydrolysing)